MLGSLVCFSHKAESKCWHCILYTKPWKKNLISIFKNKKPFGVLSDFGISKLFSTFDLPKCRSTSIMRLINNCRCRKLSEICFHIGRRTPYVFENGK